MKNKNSLKCRGFFLSGTLQNTKAMGHWDTTHIRDKGHITTKCNLGSCVIFSSVTQSFHYKGRFIDEESFYLCKNDMYFK